MSVLLPDLERQLRAAIRSDAAAPRQYRRGIAGLAAAVLATAAVAVVALQLHAGHRATRAPATAFGLAVQAPSQLLPPVLRPGQYWYQRVVQVKPAVEVVRYRGQLLQLPETRHSLYESWTGTDLRTSAREVEIGTPAFPSGHDRAVWLASGSPTAPPFDYRASPMLPWLSGGYPKLRALPTQPAPLLHLAHQAATRTLRRGHSDRPLPSDLITTEFNDLVDLLDAPTTIGTRHALLDALAMVPGVTRQTHAADLIGRHGTSLSLLGHTIIYDPGTGAVLGEEISGPKASQLRLAYISSGVVNNRGALPTGTTKIK